MKHINESQPYKASFIKISNSIIISVFVLMSVFCISPSTVFADTTENADSFNDFESALANVDNGGEIIITDNIVMTDTISLPAGKEITIRSATGSIITLERATDFNGGFFSIPDTSTVNFTHIILDGKGYDANSPLIYNNGTLNLDTGTMLTNNKKKVPTYVGGGVYNSGTLKIADGAAISNCFSGSYGGGAVQNEGNIVMTGGIIIGNTGEGAIQNASSGTFTMSGGTITGNMDPYGDAFGAGAGVHHYGSSFYISGNARISTNNVNLDDRIIRITGVLSGSVAVYAPSDTADGTVIATGDGYTLQESDRAVFSVSGFNLLLEDNNIVLYTITPTIPSEPTPDTLISVTGVTLNKQSTEIYVDKTLQLTATIVPSDATNKSVTWSSSDPGIAEVDKNGKVMGIKTGIATITVATDDGGHTATCKITVMEVDTPQTGDNDNRLPWMATGLISMIALFYLLIQKKLL